MHILHEAHKRTLQRGGPMSGSTCMPHTQATCEGGFFSTNLGRTSKLSPLDQKVVTFTKASYFEHALAKKRFLGLTTLMTALCYTVFLSRSVVVNLNGVLAYHGCLDHPAFIGLAAREFIS